ncbi:phytoene desaturase family protein [Arthrobacter sp. JSM 101049]|uniref:phytoene desaturase family protein n=1 Tax=Arthrobacter sp. JSM 101049 TaxID=929097 RepID=UPI003567A851
MNRSAIVVGSGPNGLAAAGLLASRGVEVTVYEQAAEPGGGARSGEPLGTGMITDLGAAAHPFGVGSPAFRALGLEEHGLEWVHPRYPMAHPLSGQDSAILHRDAAATATQFGADAAAWLRVHRPVTAQPLQTLENITGPLLRPPPHLQPMASFGMRALWPAAALARGFFKTAEARALFGGSAAHSMLPLGHPFSAAFGVVFGGLGQTSGWPVARGGTGQIIEALLAVLRSNGVHVKTGAPVTDLRDLPAADAVLLDLTPRQILDLAGTQLSGRYRGWLRRWKYGTGAFKVDYLLDGPVPWTDERTAHAGTVHVVGSFEELVHAEHLTGKGRLPDRPFVMAAQQSMADPSRVSGGRQVLWSYAHVPNGCQAEVGPLIDAQIERFAPGFRDRIVERIETPPDALQSWNPNLVGGDIGGGSLRGTQQILRPVPTLRPYNTSQTGLYICSSSAPPGGGVHGMAGWHAAEAVFKDWERERR